MAVEGGATSPGPREKLDAQIKSADMVMTPHAAVYLWAWTDLGCNRRKTCSRRPSTSVRRPLLGGKHTPGRTDADDKSSSRGNGEVHDREGTQLPSHASLGLRPPLLYREAVIRTRFSRDGRLWSLTLRMAGHCPAHQENIRRAKGPHMALHRRAELWKFRDPWYGYSYFSRIRSDGCGLTSPAETKHFIYFYLGHCAILLFKTQ